MEHPVDDISCFTMYTYTGCPKDNFKHVLDLETPCVLAYVSIYRVSQSLWTL